MVLTQTHQPIPLVTNKDGVILVGSTRVLLDTIIYAFNNGATAEEIAQQYSSLKLADIYSVISFYLQNKQKVESYLDKRKEHSKKVRTQNEARYNPNGIRERLLNRTSKRAID